MHVQFVYVCVLLGSVGVSLGSGSVTRQGPNNEVMRSFVGPVARQRPVSNSGVVFTLGSVLRARCRGNIFLLMQA
jgi:hypothetical protein